MPTEAKRETVAELREELANARGLSKYNVALADFLHPPEIQSIDVSSYQGKAGEIIVITAVDDVQHAGHGFEADVVLIRRDIIRQHGKLRLLTFQHIMPRMAAHRRTGQCRNLKRRMA